MSQLEHIKPIINRVMEQIKEKTKRVELFGNSEQLKVGFKDMLSVEGN